MGRFSLLKPILVVVEVALSMHMEVCIGLWAENMMLCTFTPKQFALPKSPNDQLACCPIRLCGTLVCFAPLP